MVWRRSERLDGQRLYAFAVNDEFNVQGSKFNVELRLSWKCQEISQAGSVLDEIRKSGFIDKFMS